LKIEFINSLSMNDCVSHPYIGKGDAGYSLESAHIAACGLRFEGLDH
jgi:hypothetical protein